MHLRSQRQTYGSIETSDETPAETLTPQPSYANCILAGVIAIFVIFIIYTGQNAFSLRDTDQLVHSNEALLPFSTLSPHEAAPALHYINRRPIPFGAGAPSNPGPAFRQLIDRGRPLPTNNWAENLFLGESLRSEANRVYQVL